MSNKKIIVSFNGANAKTPNATSYITRLEFDDVVSSLEVGADPSLVNQVNQNTITLNNLNTFVGTQSSGVIKDLQDNVNDYEARIITLEQASGIVSPIIEKDTFDDFDSTGEGGKLYIDKDENVIYRWDDVNLGYAQLNEGGVDNSEILDPLAAFVGTETSGNLKTTMDDLQTLHGIVTSQLETLNNLVYKITHAGRLLLKTRIDDQYNDPVSMSIDPTATGGDVVLGIFKVDGVMMAFYNNGKVYVLDSDVWTLTTTTGSIDRVMQVENNVVSIYNEDYHIFNNTGESPTTYTLSGINRIYQCGNKYIYTLSGSINTNIYVGDTISTVTSTTKSGDDAVTYLSYSPYLKATVVASDDGLSVYRSEDLSTWTKYTCGIDSSSVVNILWHPLVNKYFILKQNNEMLSSEDGITWDVYILDFITIIDMGWSDNLKLMYIINNDETVDNSATVSFISVSSDGLTWSKLLSQSPIHSGLSDSTDGEIMLWYTQVEPTKLTKKEWGLDNIINDLDTRLRIIGA